MKFLISNCLSLNQLDETLKIEVHLVFYSDFLRFQFTLSLISKLISGVLFTSNISINLIKNSNKHTSTFNLCQS